MKCLCFLMPFPNDITAFLERSFVLTVVKTVSAPAIVQYQLLLLLSVFFAHADAKISQSFHLGVACSFVQSSVAEHLNCFQRIVNTITANILSICLLFYHV